MGSQDLTWLVGELRALAGDLHAGEGETPLVVAIDQGGHASRAIAFDLTGTAIAESYCAISTFRSGKDRVEHDAHEVTQSIRTALTDLQQALGSAVDRVVAAGLATQRSSIACWDQRTHQPLSPILSWQDRRHATFVERLRPHEADIRARTGLVLSPHYGASKLRWCLDNVDAVRDAAKHKRLAAGPLSAWLLRSLLIERPHLVDAVNAARTQLLDLHTHAWSSELTTLFGVPQTVLPSVVANRHAFGHIAFGARRIPVTVCTGDQAAMPFALGRPDAQTIYLNIGTGAFLQRSAEQAEAPQGLLAGLMFTSERDGVMQVAHSIEGTVNGAGSAIDWLSERAGIDTHRAAHAMTREQAATLTPPIFVNGVSGVGSPYWRSQLDSRFSGEGGATARLIAVLESIAFLICANIERMREGVQRVRISGGLSSSDYLCECIATLSGLTIERLTLPESTATGLAFLVAGEPADWRPNPELERFVGVTDNELSRRYEQWRRLMDEAA